MSAVTKPEARSICGAHGQARLNGEMGLRRRLEGDAGGSQIDFAAICPNEAISPKAGRNAIPVSHGHV
jgi:hypothetical protein